MESAAVAESMTVFHRLALIFVFGATCWGLEAQQNHNPVPLGVSRMRDIIKKTLQLGFAQHLCLFTLADEFSPLCLDVVDRASIFIMR